MFEYIILIYTCIIFLIGIYAPIPYGRYCATWDLPLKINNRLAWVFANIFALIALVIQVLLTLPQGTLGSIVFTFLCVHFTWRAIVSQIWIGLLYEDQKETSFLVALFLASFNVFVGIMFGQMVHTINEPIQWYHVLWLCGCSVSLVLNGYYDIWVNTNREQLGTTTDVGKYIPVGILNNYFEFLFRVGIIAPNYLFEIIEWGCFFLLTLHTEAFAYLIAVAIILMIRGGQLSVWYLYLK
jgi:hypothetical protein